MPNNGKKWEDDFKKSCDEQGVTCIRIRDVQSYYGIHNPGDFFYYSYPNGAVIECKSGDTNISKALVYGKDRGQLDEILKITRSTGFHTVYLMRFMKYNMAFLVTAQEVEKWFEAGNKSIKKKDLEQGLIKHKLLEVSIPRTRWRIQNVKEFFKG